MSIISAVDTVNTSVTQTTKTETSVLDKDDFLKLFVAQLQAQDPLDPMDPTEFTTQLAEFTSLEQLYNVNTNLSTLLTTQATTNNFLANDLLGKTIQASGNSVELEDGVAGSITFSLDGFAADTTVTLYDASGNAVKTIDAGTLDAGENSVAWDGTDDNGAQLSDGEYTFGIQAVDSSGNEVDATTYTQGKVTGVLYSGGIAYLKIGNLAISLSKVVNITES